MARTTDDERRRVAAALRSYDGSGVEVDTTGKITALSIGGITALIIGAGDDEGWSWAEIYARLADLIDPGTAEGLTSSDTTATHADATATCDVSQSRRSDVDRGALLALADEMKTSADLLMKDDVYTFVRAGALLVYADRIREACGVVA